MTDAPLTLLLLTLAGLAVAFAVAPKDDAPLHVCEACKYAEKGVRPNEHGQKVCNKCWLKQQFHGRPLDDRLNGGVR